MSVWWPTPRAARGWGAGHNGGCDGSHPVAHAAGNAAWIPVEDGYPMRVARQIRAHRFWSRERPPGIHHPFIHSHARSGMSHCANTAGPARPTAHRRARDP
jgi:hypothetical protein